MCLYTRIRIDRNGYQPEHLGIPQTGQTRANPSKVIHHSFSNEGLCFPTATRRLQWFIGSKYTHAKEQKEEQQNYIHSKLRLAIETSHPNPTHISIRELLQA